MAVAGFAFPDSGTIESGGEDVIWAHAEGRPGAAPRTCARGAEDRAAQGYGDRIGMLNFGGLQQVGSPKELDERPASAFVAGFIGETNFWPARAKADAAAGMEAEVELDGGDSARVSAVDALRRGRAAQVATRPEHIKLAPNGIGATIEHAICAGSITTLRAKMRGPTLLVRLEMPEATPRPR